MNNLFIPVIVGTNRKDRKSIHVAKLIADVGNNRDGIITQLVDPEDFNIQYDGNDDYNRNPRYTEIVNKADAFFLAVPEYNHSFPASLKRLMDSEPDGYKHKPVAFAGVSSGPWGGVRGIESLLPWIRTIGLVATVADVHFPHVGQIFDNNGNLLEDSFIRRVEKAYDELIWMTKTLKWGRENIG